MTIGVIYRPFHGLGEVLASDPALTRGALRCRHLRWLNAGFFFQRTFNLFNSPLKDSLKIKKGLFEQATEQFYFLKNSSLFLNFIFNGVNHIISSIYMKKHLFYKAFVTFLFLLLGLTVFGQKSTDENIAKTLEEYLTRMTAFGFGGAVLVEHDGKIIFQKGYGMANVEKQTPFTIDTPYPINSISKQFTALSILRLEEQGKLKVSDPITKFIKEVPEDKKAITIHQLLTHSAGFGDNYAGANISGRDEAVKAILNQPLIYPIGEKMVYSNDGYELLAAIVEIVSGQPLRDFIRQNLFIPAGMKTAGFRGEGNFWKNEEVSHPYNYFVDNGSPQFDKVDWDGYGSGDMVVSIRDLFKWELSLRENKVLSPSIKQKMFSPYTLFRENWHYGYGWFIINSDRGTTEYYHGGGDVPRGFTSSYTRYPSEKMTIIIFTNTMIDEIGFLRVVKDDIDAIAFGKKADLPPSFINPNSLRLQKYAGFYQTATNEKFVVQFKDNQLRIGALDQNAINFLTSPDKTVQEILEKNNKLTTDFIEKVSQSSDQTMPFQTNFKSLEKKYGDYKGYELLGTYSVAPAYKVFTTFIKLKFANGDEVVRFVRRGDNTYPLMGNPYPALTPVMPQTNENFVGFYPILKKTIQLKFEINKNNEVISLSLDNGNQNLTAKKL